MKIICVGRNYAEHVKELNHTLPTVPVIFMKPDTAILKNNQPFYHPEFSSDIHHEVEVVLRISKEGKHIAEKFASGYFDAIGLGIDFTARDIQQKHKEAGLPWELAKAFDNSAAISEFIPKADFKDLRNLEFTLEVNEKIAQHGDTKDLIFSFEFLITFISQYITLKKGDLIFTGTPHGVARVSAGDHLCAYFKKNHKLLDFFVR